MGNDQRCEACGKPVGRAWVTAEGKVWHPEHFTCSLCRQPLTERYSRSDLWPDWRICGRHGSLIPCDCCGRAFPGAHNDPAVLDRCEICLRAAVERDSDARDRFHRSVGWLKKQGLEGDGKAALKLHLVDARWLHANHAGAAGGQTLGVAQSRYVDYGNGRRDYTHEGIAVLRGLPDPQFEGVVIHELGHAWLTIRGVHGLPQRDEEGFCQMLAHRFYRRSPHPAAAGYAVGIEQSPDPIYGDGFRAVHHLVEQVGFDRVIRSLADEGRFPAPEQRRRWF
jgi:hypothetical protein